MLDDRSRDFLRILVAAVLLGACSDGGGAGPAVERPPFQAPRPCLTADSWCMERVPMGGGVGLPVYRSLPLLDGDTAVTRAVIVIHGTDRNADDYYETLVHAARSAGALERTLLLSPRFQTADDGPSSGEPIWTSPGWKRGDPSLGWSGAPGGLSSYAALDSLISILGDRSRFPGLDTVVVTGHSAGGQVVHRYAASSPMPERFPGIHFRYVPANPSTWLYPGPERRGVGGGRWGIPDGEECPDYNAWHYGLEGPNPYVEGQGADRLRPRLREREVVYAVGDDDTGTNLLDMSCGAMLQGRNRYERGLAIFDWVEDHLPDHRSRLLVVPGVGHSSAGIYGSAGGRGALFGG